MLKKFKKLGLALLLPATAMVIATPLVLTSCNASESLVVESEKQNNENLVVDSTTSDQTKTETQQEEKIVKTLQSRVYSKGFLLKEYFFPELIREFIGFPESKPIKFATGGPETSNVKAPASTKFKDELNKGTLNSAIKVFNLASKFKINKIDIKQGGEFEILEPGYKENPNDQSSTSLYPFGALQIPITVTAELLKQNVLSQKETTTNNKDSDFKLIIEPKITTFDELEQINVGLDVLYKSSYNTSTFKNRNSNSHLKDDIKKLHDEFQTNINGKESVLEQALSYNFTTQGGLVSYEVSFEYIKKTGVTETPSDEISSLAHILFIPFKIKGDYTYYLDNYNELNKPTIRTSSLLHKSNLEFLSKNSSNSN